MKGWGPQHPPLPPPWLPWLRRPQDQPSGLVPSCRAQCPSQVSLTTWGVLVSTTAPDLTPSDSLTGGSAEIQDGPRQPRIRLWAGLPWLLGAHAENVLPAFSRFWRCPHASAHGPFLQLPSQQRSFHLPRATSSLGFCLFCRPPGAAGCYSVVTAARSRAPVGTFAGLG